QGKASPRHHRFQEAHQRHRHRRQRHPLRRHHDGSLRPPRRRRAAETCPRTHPGRGEIKARAVLANVLSLSPMKRALVCLFAAALLGGSAGARDLKTISGEVYKNVEVRTKDPTGIQIMHDEGVVFLDFKNLSAADQKEFGYNPETYAEGWKQKF